MRIEKNKSENLFTIPKNLEDKSKEYFENLEFVENDDKSKTKSELGSKNFISKDNSLTDLNSNILDIRKKCVSQNFNKTDSSKIDFHLSSNSISNPIQNVIYKKQDTFTFGIDVNKNKFLIDDLVKGAKRKNTSNLNYHKPIFSIDIKIKEGITDKLDFFLDDFPKEKIEKFCRKHGLNNNKKKVILELVNEKLYINQ